ARNTLTNVLHQIGIRCAMLPISERQVRSSSAFCTLSVAFGTHSYKERAPVVDLHRGYLLRQRRTPENRRKRECDRDPNVRKSWSTQTRYDCVDAVLAAPKEMSHGSLKNAQRILSSWATKVS